MKTLMLIGLLTGSLTALHAQPNVTAPPSPNICTGSNANFSVIATGSGPFTYQWQESADGISWNPLINGASNQATHTTGVYTGTNTPVLVITRVPSTMDQYLYNVMVTDNLHHTTISTPALLSVGPNISLDDQPKSGCPTANVTFNTPAVSGITYQWQVSSNSGTSWSNIANGTDASSAIYSGATANNLTITNLPVSFNSNLYRYTALGLGCNVTSGNITLSVPALAVVANPSNAVVDGSNNATFTVAASGGSAPYSYKWTVSTNGGFNYTNITDNAMYSGSSTSTLNITGVTSVMFNYLYRPVVRNSGLCATANINFAKLATNSVLAMQLQSFTAQKIAASVQLSWLNSHPLLSQSYTIQRSSDNQTFTDIGKIKGDSINTAYSYLDEKPADGTSLYRLKLTGWDASLSYSTVVSIQNDNTSKIELRPSITSTRSTSLYTNLTRSNPVTITITDVTGRQLLSRIIKLQKGEDHTPIDVSRLTKGIYYIHISSIDGISKTLPLLIEP